MYNTGLYGGTFNPLHLGHVNCIFQAANLCRELYIILSVGINRDEIDERVRYRWLYQLTSHIGNVKILILHDEGTDKHIYSREESLRDTEKIKKMIGKPVDVVFCGSDYTSDSFWNTNYPESDLYVFERNGISSTDIRNDVYGNWDKIPDVVKPYYVKKVLLAGIESCGKSVLTKNLAHYFSTNYIEEAGRELSVKSGTDQYMLPEDFTEILITHKMNEIKAAGHSNKILFIDTDALITRFYLDYLDSSGKEKNAALADAIDGLNHYDLILFLTPDGVPFVRDGDRSQATPEQREYYSRIYQKIYHDHHKSLTLLPGSYQEKYLKAIDEVNKLLTAND